MFKKSNEFSALMMDLTKTSDGKAFVRRLLDRNQIEIGGDVGYRLNDPIIQILIDPDDADDTWTIKTTTVFTYTPQAVVYIDEFSAIQVDELDEEFKELYDEEFLKINYMADIISNLMESSSGKTEIEKFSQECAFKMSDDGDRLVVDGRTAYQEIARSLEKNGVIKIKGDTIKWKH
jgi:hypothetical protein